MMNRKKILIGETKDFSKDVIERLSEYAEVEVRDCVENDISSVLQNYDVFWFRLSFKINESLLGRPNNKCKILATPVTGIDHIDEESCKRHNVKIICLRGEVNFLKTVRATAELTIGLTLALLRNITEASISVKNGQWNRDLFRGNELFGKTVGIIGYGRLGEIVADYFLAFGMKIIVYDIKKISPSKSVQVSNSLEDLLIESDIVSIHVNYNSSNHHLIGKEQLKVFKKNAVLINTSRGGLIDEDALITALKDKKISGAALDVLQGEPKINLDHPLIKYSLENSNVLIVPHIGGNTYESFEKTESFIANKIIELIKQGEI